MASQRCGDADDAHAVRRDRHRRRPQRPRRRRLPRRGRAAGSSSSSDATGRRRGRHRRARARASGSRRSPTRSGGCGRRSSASSTSRGHGLSLVAPDVRVFAPAAGRRGRRRSGRDVARTADGAPGALGARRRRLRRASTDASARSARFLAELGDHDAARHRVTGAGRRAHRVCKLGRAFRGLGRRRRPDDPAGPADGRRRLRGRVVRGRRSSGRRSPGAASRYTAMGPWSAGTTAVLLADSAGNDGGAAGETVFARGGPGALSAALVGATRGRRRDPDRRRGRRHHRARRPGRPASSSPSGEEIAARAVVAAVDPKRAPDRPRRPGRARAVPRAGGPATSGRRARSPRSTSSSPGCRRSRRPATRRSACSAGGSRSGPGIDALERAFDATQVRRDAASTPILEATIPSLVDPSLVDGRGGGAGTHVMSVIVQWLPYRLREGDWDARRDELGDLVVGDARALRAGHRPGRSSPGRCSPRSTSSATTG